LPRVLRSAPRFLRSLVTREMLPPRVRAWLFGAVQGEHERARAAARASKT